MKQLIREPLLHFLLLGTAIFAAYGIGSRRSSDEGGQIVITQGQLASMWEGFTATRQRTPDAVEWEGLIRARVREEVYYREALALGLDQDDAVIRRRLQQKMAFVSEDTEAQAPPTDAELNVYLQAHVEKFRVASQFTFHQAYLNPEKHGANLARDAAQLLAALNQAGVDSRTAPTGDPLPLDRHYTLAPANQVAAQFGGAFAARLAAAPVGQWQGPIESSFGQHLIFVAARNDGRVPALTEVRDAVRREWDDTRRQEANEKSYQDLLKRYTVTIENLAPPDVPTRK